MPRWMSATVEAGVEEAMKRISVGKEARKSGTYDPVMLSGPIEIGKSIRMGREALTGRTQKGLTNTYQGPKVVSK